MNVSHYTVRDSKIGFSDGPKPRDWTISTSPYFPNTGDVHDFSPWKSVYAQFLRWRERDISSEEVFEEAEWKSVCTILNQIGGLYPSPKGLVGRQGSKKKESSRSQSDMGRFKAAERVCSYVELNTRSLVN